MLKTLQNLAARIKEQVGLTWKAFKAQLAVLLGYKADIGGPVRLGFIVGYYIEDQKLAYRFCQALVDVVIQTILDKDPIEDIPGLAEDTEGNFLRFEKHCSHLFTVEEMYKIREAFFKAEKGFPEHLMFRAAKEINGDISKLSHVVELLRKYRKRYRTKQYKNNPYDDPRNWFSNNIVRTKEDEENADPDDIQTELGMLKKYLSEVWLAGAAVDIGKYYIVASVREIYKAIKRSRKQWAIRRMKELLLRYAGVHAKDINRLFLVLEDDEKLKQFVFRAKHEKSRKELWDGISFATSNKPGVMICRKSKNRLYTDRRYKMNPESDTAKVKRAPGTSIHYAIKMKNRKQYIKTDLVKSSTQAIALFPLDDKKGFERLSNGMFSSQGDGVFIGEPLGKMMDEIELPNAKFNANYLKSKGIGIHRRELKVKIGEKTYDADIMFGLQETRGFDRAMYSPATQMLNAWLKGQNKVEVKTGVEPELVVGEIIDDYGNPMKVIVGLVELQVDASVDRSTGKKIKKIMYPQLATFAPKAYEDMQPILDRHLKHRKYEIERAFQIINKYNQLRKILIESCTLDDPTDKDLNEVFNEIMDASDPAIPDGLLPALRIVEEQVPWQDSDLENEEVAKILAEVDEFVTIRGIDIKPIKYLIQHEGRTMISPELRLLMDAVNRDTDKKGHQYTYLNLVKYFNFVIKHLRSIMRPSYEVVGGKHATGGFDRGVILPYKEEYVKLLLKQSTKLSDKAIDDLIDAGIDKVNDVFKTLKFMVHRDPVLKEIPRETVQFSNKLTMDVIVVGKKTAEYINGDDDDDNVAIYSLVKKGNITSGFVAGLSGHYYGTLDNHIDVEAEIIQYFNSRRE